MDMLNRPVKHTKFGSGRIKSCENGTVQIYFDQYGNRCFHYPEAFDKFLSTEDEALKIQVNADLDAWRLTRAAEDAQLAASVSAIVKEARPVRKPAARKRAAPKSR